MKTCKCCNLYIDENSKFCPYCGKELWKAVQKVELEPATQNLTVRQEVYKYKGEERNRYAFYTDLQDKISSFVPDFSAKIEDAWLFGDDRIFIVTNQQGIVKLRELGINKKGSTEICKLPSGNNQYSRKLYTTKDGRFLLTENGNIYGRHVTDFHLININDIITYSVENDVSDVELYSDDSIVCNQGENEVYILTADGMVQTVSALYDKDELLRRYHMQCIEDDRFYHPEIIWDSPDIKHQTIDRNSGEIYVTLCCGRYREGNPEDELFVYRPFSYLHNDTFIVEPEENLPIEQITPVVMDASEWEEEAADIRHMEELQKKENSQWQTHDKLCAFYIGEKIIYGTDEKEQFIYNKEHREVLFFPIGKHEKVLEYAKEYTNKHPENILNAQKLEQMHLLDSVTNKLIRTHETRLQPFLQYMEKAWQYDSMVKGEKNFCNITYSIERLQADTDMVIGVAYTDDEGKGWISWTEQDVIYTERATHMVVRMITPYGKKVVDIPFGTKALSGVYMTDDQPANNRSEWWKNSNAEMKFAPIPRIMSKDEIPVPRSNFINGFTLKDGTAIKEYMDDNGIKEVTYSEWMTTSTREERQQKHERVGKKPYDIYYNSDGISYPVPYLSGISGLCCDVGGCFFVKGCSIYHLDAVTKECRKVGDINFSGCDMMLFMVYEKYLVMTYATYQETHSCEFNMGDGERFYFSVTRNVCLINKVTGECIDNKTTSEEPFTADLGRIFAEIYIEIRK